ncbi:MAG TPA: adenylyltransferase/cytidyltransferase family protein [Actinoplanes sp.]|nr:adenylyltransferase/cytidyltransferase family protein [Actinoplanes sp.]
MRFGHGLIVGKFYPPHLGHHELIRAAERECERVTVVVAPAVRELVRPADLYLLTDDDGVPFEDDGLRDGEHLRRWMTGRFRDELRAHGVRNRELTGTYGRRLRAAVRATDDLLARGWTFAPPLSAAAPKPIGR